MFDFILDRLYRRSELREFGVTDRVRHDLESDGLLTPIRISKSGWKRYSGTQLRELLEAKHVSEQAARKESVRA